MNSKCLKSLALSAVILGIPLFIVAIMVFPTFKRHNDLVKNLCSEQEAKLKPLLQERATREKTISILGPDFTDFSIGSTNLLIMHPNTMAALKPTISKYTNAPGVLCYSTPYVITWLYFDDKDRMINYAVTAQ